MTDQPKSMQELWQESYLAPGNEAYLEELYETYLRNPQDVEPEWRQYFDQLIQQIARSQPDVPHDEIQAQFLALSRQSSRAVATASGMNTQHDEQQERVIELINAYRRLGHLKATTDPLNLKEPKDRPMLNLSYHGFNDQDLSKSFSVSSFEGLNKQEATLKEIHDALKRIYCGSIGFEYMHINRNDEVEWLRDRIERGYSDYQPSKEQKLKILDRLVVADGLEKYLGFKYVGQKRFSLEGGDSLIPMLDGIVNRGVENGVKEVIIGMAHRGRLNVLVNIVGKPTQEIFDAFEGKGVSTQYSGDVKYHLGASTNVNTPHGPVHMMLSFNPSHLEIVSPVVQGSVRVRQRRRKDSEHHKIVPIQIHGDSAFAGQGVVMETFSMSQARWFTVGGSVHIIVNNQVGFTTSNRHDTRSSLYSSDIAKMIGAPILHVNGNDPEAVYFAALLAIDYRQKFKRDVVVDLVCYRRHGHNEADEPRATQPLMYQHVKQMKPVYNLYAEKLAQEGVITKDVEKQMANNYRDALDAGKTVVDVITDKKVYEYSANWTPYINTQWTEEVDTTITKEQIAEYTNSLAQYPEGFVLQPQVKKMLDARLKMADGEIPLNWGGAEVLAYASLLAEGYPIRLCGQDAGRGTFAHRHAVLHDQKTGECFVPLGHVANGQAQINIVDSFLSEEAVLAFEYGYATTDPKFLTIWEAQFGDFANGAQVVIDQFISSGEQKWGRLCGLVMLLPHGYEGQGPEHSSARLERFLQLAAQENIQVCNLSTPSQIFHALRRQMLRPYRKPLIIMSPKSVLRHPLAVSQLDDLTDGGFELVIPEIDEHDSATIDRVVLCSGKVYYDLIQKRREDKLTNVAIIRVEQLYPFPENAIKAVLSKYTQVNDFVWCQEEPENQGAYLFMQRELNGLLNKNETLTYAGRHASASPAGGYHSVHEKEQNQLVADALLGRKS